MTSVKNAFDSKTLGHDYCRGKGMKIAIYAVLSAVVLTGCVSTQQARRSATVGDYTELQTVMPGIPYVAPASTEPQAPMQQYTYVFPDSNNACAPDPQRFVAASGAITYRVKDCSKDEYDYYPEAQKSKVDALVAQCRAKCPAAS